VPTTTIENQGGTLMLPVNAADKSGELHSHTEEFARKHKTKCARRSAHSFTTLFITTDHKYRQKGCDAVIGREPKLFERSSKPRVGKHESRKAWFMFCVYANTVAPLYFHYAGT
jgi:hypothetical protein